MEGTGAPAVGIWTCGDCGDLNFGSSGNQCVVCGRDRDGPISSWGGFPPGIWSQTANDRSVAGVGNASSRVAAAQETPESPHERPHWNESVITGNGQNVAQDVMAAESSRVGPKDNGPELPTMATIPIPQDLWLCGSCESGNVIVFNPSVCTICSHKRDYNIGCCGNPGELFYDWSNVARPANVTSDLPRDPGPRNFKFLEPDNFKKSSEGHAREERTREDHALRNTASEDFALELISNKGDACRDTSPSRSDEWPEQSARLWGSTSDSGHGGEYRPRRPSIAFSSSSANSELSVASMASYAQSELSVASIASSATNLSLHSKYPAAQIEQATRELISTLQDDETLSSLYMRAVADVKIGPQKLERNLCRFFKTYSEQLKQESGDTLELQAARLVRLKARPVARCIIQKHTMGHSASYDVKHPNLTEQQEQSSDDEVEPQPVNEELLQNMDDLRRFLTGGEAFKALQKQIRSFVIPKLAKQEPPEQPNEVVTVSTLLSPVGKNDHDNDMMTVADGSGHTQIDSKKPRVVADVDTRNIRDQPVFYLIRKFALYLHIMSRFGEAPTQPGFTRLRWNCKCGHTICGDVTEHQEGGVAETVERIRASTATDVVVTTAGQEPSTQAWTFQKIEWIRGIRRRLSTLYRRRTDRDSELPQHAPPTSTQTCAPAGTTPSQQPNLLLLSCMKRGKYFRQLYQDCVDGIGTDQALFRFMQKQIKQRQGRVRRMFSFESIRGIYFVKFDLRPSGYADVHTHILGSTCAQSRTCDSLPPKSRVEPSPGAEYRCKPHGPPKLCPLFLSEELMHWLTSPRCIDPKATTVLEQIPKRTKGELKPMTGETAEGWGIHFQVGNDFGLVFGMILAAFLLGSFLFGVLWSYFELDVQGAFGVSSYVATLAGVFVAWFAVQARMME